MTSATLTLLLLSCQPAPQPAPPAPARPEIYGGLAIRPSGGVSSIAWGPGGAVVVVPAFAADEDATSDKDSPFGPIVLLDPESGAIRGVIEAPCAWPGPLAASPEFPLVVARCGETVFAIDPRTGQDKVVETASTDLAVADALVILVGHRLDIYDETLTRRASVALHRTPMQWTAARALVAAVTENVTGDGGLALSWRSPEGQGSAAIEGLDQVDALVSDGRRIVLSSGTSLHWFDAVERRWLGTTSDVALAPPAPILTMDQVPPIHFVGDTLWVATQTGWRRFTSPTDEIATVALFIRGATSAASSAGMLLADPMGFVAWAPDGQPLSPAPSWLSLRGVGLSRDGRVLVAVTQGGVTAIDRLTKVERAWPDEAAQAWISPDGYWLAETDATLGRLWFRDLRDGKTHEANGVPPADRRGAIEGPGWAMHGLWSETGDFVGVWRGWTSAWVRRWTPTSGAPGTMRVLDGLVSGGHDLPDELWALSPDGARLYTTSVGGLREDRLDRDSAATTLPTRDWPMDAATSPGDVAALTCAVHYPDAVSGRSYQCQRESLTSGESTAFPNADDLRLSADGSLIFARDGDTAVNVYGSDGALLRRVPLAGPGQWPDHNPCFDGAVAARSMVFPLRDGRVQVIDAEE